MATQQTVNILINALKQQGILNTYVHSGIVAVIGTESNYVPKREASFRNTDNSRLRTIFGSRLEKYSDEQLTNLKKQDELFFDVIYGGKYGNIKRGDGWKYRGGGFNQITFYENYLRYGKAIGIDLINNPERLNEVPVAAAAMAVYFSDTFKSAKANGSLKSKIGVSDISEVKDFQTGVKLALQANAGFGKDLSVPFYREVYKKAMAHLEKLYDTLKANPGKTVAGVLFLTAFFFTGYRLLTRKRK